MANRQKRLGIIFKYVCDLEQHFVIIIIHAVIGGTWGFLAVSLPKQKGTVECETPNSKTRDEKISIFLKPTLFWSL